MEKTEQRFSIKKISISRGYSENTPFEANVSVKSSWDTEITVKLPEERVLQIIDIVADIITESLIGQFDNMREDHVAALEKKKQEALPAPIEATAEEDNG